VEIENLVLVVVYDEHQPSGKLALRLAGFTGARVPWGVQWGGVDHSLFFKDLFLRPEPRARGGRLDASRESLLALALRLDRQIERQARCPWTWRRRRLSLPRLWAGFRASLAPQISGDGPELAEAVRRTGRNSHQLLAESKREHGGLALYPLDWVSHHWQRITAVFADLAAFPQGQVFPLWHWPEDLEGYRGASRFDLFHSRFRRPVEPKQRIGSAAVALV
jgi:hypothetical protein